MIRGQNLAHQGGGTGGVMENWFRIPIGSGDVSSCFWLPENKRDNNCNHWWQLWGEAFKVSWVTGKYREEWCRCLWSRHNSVSTIIPHESPNIWKKRLLMYAEMWINCSNYCKPNHASIVIFDNSLYVLRIEKIIIFCTFGFLTFFKFNTLLVNLDINRRPAPRAAQILGLGPLTAGCGNQ